MAGVPVGRLPAHDDPLIRVPGREREGAVTNEFSGIGPFAALLLDGAPIDGEPGSAGDIGEELRRRLAEPDHQRVFIRRGEAGLRKIA